jgi:hypothetical protein
VEVVVNKLEYELRALAKETTRQVAVATILKKQYEWLVEQRQWGIDTTTECLYFTNSADARGRVSQQSVGPNGITV